MAMSFADTVVSLVKRGFSLEIIIMVGRLEKKISVNYSNVLKGLVEVQYKYKQSLNYTLTDVILHIPIDYLITEIESILARPQYIKSLLISDK